MDHKSTTQSNADRANQIRGRLNAHVEAAAIQAALELELLKPLLDGPATAAGLAERAGCDPHGALVCLDLLAGLGTLTRDGHGCYELPPAYAAAFDPQSPAFAGSAVAQAARCWHQLGDPDAFGECLAVATGAIAQAPPASAPLVRLAWGHLWSAALMHLAALGVFRALSEQPRHREDLAAHIGTPAGVPAPLLAAGQDIGLLETSGEQIGLTEAGRLALGKGTVKDYCGWMEQRLVFERQSFWAPLARLSESIRAGEPITRDSAPGFNSTFRQSFTTINRPLVPLLHAVARKVVRTLGLEGRPIRALEAGASLGHWGMVLAATHPDSRIDAVDVAAALKATQRNVAAARLSDRYTWLPDEAFQFEQLYGQYDIIVLNEICHTLPTAQLSQTLARLAGHLKPDGLLVVADMVLENDGAGPLRHLISAAKLYVSGGGRPRSLEDYAGLLAPAGLEHVALDRLPITDLIIASGARPLTDQLSA